MGAGSGKIVLDADASKAIAAAKKTGDAFKQATAEAAGLGKQVEKYGTQFGKTVVSVGALAKAIAATTQEVVNLQRASADASRKAGGTALDAGLAGGRLGLSGGDVQGILGGRSAKTPEEIAAFLSTLAGTKGPGKQPIGRGDAFRAAAAFKTGFFGNEEITDAAGKGTLSALLGQSGAREAGLSDDAFAELQIRRQEIGAAAEAQALRARGGARTRLAQSARDLRNARSPVGGAFRGIVGAATSVVGGDSAIEAADVALIGRKLDEQTALMRRDGSRPAVTASPDKQ